MCAERGLEGLRPPYGGAGVGSPAAQPLGPPPGLSAPPAQRRGSPWRLLNSKAEAAGSLRAELCASQSLFFKIKAYRLSVMETVTDVKRGAESTGAALE